MIKIQSNCYKILLVLIAFGFTFSSCNINDEDLEVLPKDDRTLIFGTYFGFCFGDCTQLFKMESGEIFADEGVDRLIVDEALTFQANPLPESDFALASPLYNIPDSLFLEEKTTLGIPDAYDQGGLYLELTEQDKTLRWYLDSSVSALPEYLQEYAQLIKDVTEELKQ